VSAKNLNSAKGAQEGRKTMNLRDSLPGRAIAGALALLLALPCGEVCAAQPQQTPAPQQNTQTSGMQSGTQDAASQGAVASPEIAETNLPDAPSPQGTPSGEQNQPATNPNQQTNPGQQQSGTQQPLGTAAAPYEKPEGVAASRPEGAVIAPAKQRRARAIFISLAVVAAAGIALGTVAALSHGSPSRPQ
jgi:hypothetical protein